MSSSTFMGYTIRTSTRTDTHTPFLNKTYAGREVREQCLDEVTELLHDLDDGMLPISVMFPYLPIPAHFKRDKCVVFDVAYSHMLMRTHRYSTHTHTYTYSRAHTHTHTHTHTHVRTFANAGRTRSCVTFLGASSVRVVPLATERRTACSSSSMPSEYRMLRVMPAPSH